MSKENLAQNIADWLVKYGTENTTTGKYVFSFMEIAQEFRCDPWDDKQLLMLVSESLLEENEIVSEFYVSRKREEIELHFDPDFCLNCMDK